MTRPRLPIVPLTVSPRRRGGVRGTGAASGSLTFATPTPDIARRGSPLSGHEVAVATQQQGPLLLDAHEVARLLGVGRTKVYELIASRELPVICIGRCVRVPRAQLQKWISDHTSLPHERAELGLRPN